MFEELRSKVYRQQLPLRIVVVIDGRAISGMLTADRGYVERTNTAIDGIAERLDDDDPAKAAATGLRFDPAGEESFSARYFPLWDAVLKGEQADIRLGIIRVDSQAVSAWGVCEPADKLQTAD